MLTDPPPPEHKVDLDDGVDNVWHEWFTRLRSAVLGAPVIAGVQTTTGAAGTAVALPTNPDIYIKVRLPGGAEYVVPGYRVN